MRYQDSQAVERGGIDAGAAVADDADPAKTGFVGAGMHQQLGHHRGHGEQDRGRALLHHPQHGLGLEYLHQFAGAAGQHHGQQAAAEGTHVIERRRQLKQVVRTQPHVLGLRLCCGQQAAVGECATLGAAGGARGIDDDGHVLGRDLLAQGRQPPAVGRCGQLSEQARLDGDHVAQPRHARRQPLEHREVVEIVQLGDGEYHPHLSVAEHVLHLAIAVARVERNDREAQFRGGKKNLDPFDLVLRQQGDAIAPRQPHAMQRAGQAITALLEVVEGIAAAVVDVAHGVAILVQRAAQRGRDVEVHVRFPMASCWSRLFIFISPVRQGRSGGKPARLGLKQTASARYSASSERRRSPA
ncbi:hypothetical protein D3C87_1273390 [compost metagenome]